MYNKNIKLVITALIIAYAVYQFTEGYIGNGIMFILLSTIFVFLYFKNKLASKSAENTTKKIRDQLYDLEEYAKVEQLPVLEGKRMIIQLSPKKKS